MNSKHRRGGAKGLEVEELKAALQDQRAWVKVGVVKKLAGEQEAWEFVTKDDGTKIDVIVGVKLGHTGEEIYCRLGQGAGTLGRGIWKIPAEGTEVAVVIPEGDLAADPMIIATLSTNRVPDGLDADTLVMVNPKKVIIFSEDEKVYLGSSDGSGTKPLAFKDGQVDMGKFVLNGVGTSFSKITWTPPGGGTPIDITVSPGTSLTGKISEGSATAEVKP